MPTKHPSTIQPPVSFSREATGSDSPLPCRPRRPNLVITPALAAGSYDLSWNADIGRTYDLVRTSDLSSPITWTRVALVIATATTETRTDTTPPGPPSGFYRLQEAP